ncbi:histidine kinase [Acidovorax sp. Q11]
MRAVKIPYRLTHQECNHFIHEEVINKVILQNARGVVFDFSGITFIDPSGLAALYNSIKILEHYQKEIIFTNHDMTTDVNNYLDDSGFYSTMIGTRVFQGRTRRPTTVPIHIFGINNYYGHLTGELMPWIATSLGITPQSLDVLRATLEEAYHNVAYHSGVNEGCVFAQHYPKRKTLEVIISDHGKGIPHRVRTKIPNISDSNALEQAFEKGFTTGSVVSNRGWGLWQLANFTAQKNGGHVTIRSGQGYAKAERGPEEPKIRAWKTDWAYPGTLVRVVLETDTLQELRNDTEEEVFTW